MITACKRQGWGRILQQQLGFSNRCEGHSEPSTPAQMKRHTKEIGYYRVYKKSFRMAKPVKAIF
jgi:hypothetical protein